MIFGGMEELKNKIKSLEKHAKGFFLITTCPAGIIGENVDSVKEIEKDVPIIPIKTDGNITGDYLQGMIDSYINIAKGLINKDVKKQNNLVNILAEKPISRNTEKKIGRASCRERV